MLLMLALLLVLLHLALDHLVFGAIVLYRDDDGGVESGPHDFFFPYRPGIHRHPWTTLLPHFGFVGHTFSLAVDGLQPFAYTESLPFFLCCIDSSFIFFPLLLCYILALFLGTFDEICATFFCCIDFLLAFDYVCF